MADPTPDPIPLEVDNSADEAKFAKLKDVVTSKAFAKLLTDLNDMNEYMVETDIMPHLMAARVGLQGLATRFGVTNAN